MTNDYDKLHAMKACAPALQWIGERCAITATDMGARIPHAE